MTHGGVCPCPNCAGGAGGGVLCVVLGLPVALAGAVLVALGRWVSGRVLWRPVGRWDARWATWAPPPPAWVVASRAEWVPRSTWGRRPGWQRCAVRLAVTALAPALLLAPVATLALLVGAGLALLGTWVATRRARIATAPGDVDPAGVPLPFPAGAGDELENGAGPWDAWARELYPARVVVASERADGWTPAASSPASSSPWCSTTWTEGRR